MVRYDSRMLRIASLALALTTACGPATPQRSACDDLTVGDACVPQETMDDCRELAETCDDIAVLESCPLQFACAS